MTSSPHFLIIKLGALGDIVHAIPVAAALRRTFPAARIDWVVHARHAALLELVPVIDRRIVAAGRHGSAGGLSVFATIATLRRERYDWAIDLQGLVKSAALARVSGARRVLGFAKHYLREPLARFAYTDAIAPGDGSSVFDRRETRHIVQINLSLLEAIGVSAAPPEFPLAAVESDVADDVGRRTGGAYALINPGAAWPNKRWPPARLAAVARALKRRHHLMSVVLWGPEERALADEVVAQADGAAVATPPTTIRDLVALARGAAIMVSGDTGPTYIAAAAGTPIVGIFGPTRPERNGPWRAEDRSISRASSCECHYRRQCRRERMCLLDIEADEVIAAVDARLVSAGAHG